MMLSMMCGYKCIACLVMMKHVIHVCRVACMVYELKDGKWKEERLVLCLAFIGLDIIIITCGIFWAQNGER